MWTLVPWCLQLLKASSGAVCTMGSRSPSVLSLATDALFEPPESGLPAGLLVSTCLIQVVWGKVYVPVVNVGMTEDLLYPRTLLGFLNAAQDVTLPADSTEERSTLATVSSHAVAASVPDRVELLDLSELTEHEQASINWLAHAVQPGFLWQNRTGPKLHSVQYLAFSSSSHAFCFV